ncbi:two-component response regulator [Deferribacter desulfuricans SSM1]|uniref:Two-component response regulator n=1 Tax=Deferribacter desulfuricans (strain DSM 14783 / JCM 11476 / NBRC 101012 / SSM1) TaxID=639282 RepID=D3PC79_DEFDS|nr:response regulator transcription factor [Deferribacter desulfuricans]BAI80202.1 two-component response regulator [Deferribacter desulfuricans SSM1]
MAKILIIEDEKQLNKQIKEILSEEGYTVDVSFDGATGLEKILSSPYDLIILDIMLPEINGYNILKHIRENKILTPVLMISAKGEIDDRIKGLNSGADDYLSKPFSIAELIARVKAILRRTFSQYEQIISIYNLKIDLNTRKVYINDSEVQLTSKEYGIIEYLVSNRNKVVSKFAIIEYVWGDEFDPFSMSNFLDVHIKNIRKKIGDKEYKIIQTVRGIGYLLKG